MNKEIWRGRQWRVTDHSITTIRSRKPYVPEYTIYFGRNMHMAVTTWPEHMAEKVWVDLEDFISAYAVACAFTGTKIDDLEAGIARARAAYRSRPYHPPHL
jgi:hypothetical protein